MVEGVQTYFVYDLDWNAIAEYDGGMSLQAADVTVGVDDHLARIEDSTPYYFYDDALETVAGLTDPSGDRAAYYEYDAWGNQWSWNAGPLTNPFLYTGLQYDPDSGILYVRYRYYDPTLGRFLSRDPLHRRRWGNPYTYVRAQPLISNDPSGLERQTVIAPGTFNVDIDADAANSTRIIVDITYVLTRRECQCCDEAWFVQISTYRSLTQGEGWHVDPWRSALDRSVDAKQKHPDARSPYYPYQPPHKEGRCYLTMKDAPEYVGVAGPIAWASWRFETCVVCTAGRGGYNRAILGCTRWNADYNWLLYPSWTYTGEGDKKARLRPSGAFRWCTRQRFHVL